MLRFLGAILTLFASYYHHIETFNYSLRCIYFKEQYFKKQPPQYTYLLILLITE